MAAMSAVSRPSRPLLTAIRCFSHKPDPIKSSRLDEADTIPITRDDSPHRRRHHYGLKDAKDAVYVHLGMPGVGKTNVRVFAQNKLLFVEGEEVAPGEAAPCRKLGAVVFLPAESKYRLDQTEAVMKNGMLEMVVPKLPPRPPRRYELECGVDAE